MRRFGEIDADQPQVIAQLPAVGEHLGVRGQFLEVAVQQRRAGLARCEQALIEGEHRVRRADLPFRGQLVGIGRKGQPG